MKRLVTGVVVATVAISLAAASAASSAAERRVTLDSYCSPTGDYCLVVRSKGDKVKLQISTIPISGEYRLCVRGPKTKGCGEFELSPTSDGYADSVNWNKTFGYEGPGVYTVIWKLGGEKLGKTLGFQFND